ncbi:MAG TPA: hypothetical protein ENI33_02530 [Thermoplasmatales archaeon]|nr:hypothetical protein [Thermoplasmatales archaeon]
MIWKLHNKYAKKLGVSEEKSNYVNRIVDNINLPLEYVEYVKKSVRSLKGKTAFPYVVADYMINRGHDAGRRAAKEITSKIQLDFLAQKGEEYVKAWYLHHALDIIWDKNLLENISKLKSILMDDLVQIYPDRIKYCNEIIKFIEENIEILREDIKNIHIENTKERMRDTDKEGENSFFKPFHLEGGIKIWFLCKDADKIHELILNKFDIDIASFERRKTKEGEELCYISFTLKRINSKYYLTNQRFAKILPDIINTLEKEGFNICVDTKSGWDPDLKIYWPLNWNDIVFTPEKEERLQERRESLREISLEKIARKVQYKLEKEKLYTELKKLKKEAEKLKKNMEDDHNLKGINELIKRIDEEMRKVRDNDKGK